MMSKTDNCCCGSGRPVTEVSGTEFGYIKPKLCDWRRRFFVLLTGWMLTLVLTATWTMKVTQLAPRPLCQPQSISRVPSSPVDGHIVYEDRRVMYDSDASGFEGPPRPEVEKAWYDLLQGTLIRVSEAELDAANQTSVPLKNGGYGAGLGVSHNLHCLRRIHQYIHRSYYYRHDESKWTELEEHADHCIETLRKAVMCQADTTLFPLIWTPESSLAPAVRMPHARRCVNFDSLHEWMLGRAASMDDLVKPPDSFFGER